MEKDKFDFRVTSMRIAKELVKEGFDCKVQLDEGDLFSFIFERNLEVKLAYVRAKDKFKK